MTYTAPFILRKKYAYVDIIKLIVDVCLSLELENLTFTLVQHVLSVCRLMLIQVIKPQGPYSRSNRIGRNDHFKQSDAYDIL